MGRAECRFSPLCPIGSRAGSMRRRVRDVRAGNKSQARGSRPVRCSGAGVNMIAEAITNPIATARRIPSPVNDLPVFLIGARLGLEFPAFFGWGTTTQGRITSAIPPLLEAQYNLEIA